MQHKLDQILPQIPKDALIFVIDDGSNVPLTVEGHSNLILIRHKKNKGYGAAQKTGYKAALKSGVKNIVLLHGDGQYSVPDTLNLVGGLTDYNACFGSRFLLEQEIPLWRSMGIRALTKATDIRFKIKMTDLHNGARAFRAETLAEIDFCSFADDYRFDHQLICQILRQGRGICEQPVRMTYENVLSIGFLKAIKYGFGCLTDLL